MYYMEVFSTTFYFNNLEVHMYSTTKSGKVISSIHVTVYMYLSKILFLTKFQPMHRLKNQWEFCKTASLHCLFETQC